MRQWRRMIEFHERGCPCSWCKGCEWRGVGSIALCLPIDKVWNSHRVISLVRPRGILYVRWTGFWQRRPHV